MALVSCPECGKSISTSATSCPHCGYPVAETPNIVELSEENEVSRLTSKIKPCAFFCPPPHAKVCIKCAMPTESEKCPRCKCSINGKHYPFVEVDYPAAGVCAHEGVDLWIYENCSIPRKIGDIDSKEYQNAVDKLRQDIDSLNARGLRNIHPVPPNRSLFGKEPTSEVTRDYLLALFQQEESLPKERTSNNIPACPYCRSTNLTKISKTGSFLKVYAFGIFGAGDIGKTWKCNNCGSKF